MSYLYCWLIVPLYIYPVIKLCLIATPHFLYFMLQAFASAINILKFLLDQGAPITRSIYQ